MNTKCIFTPFVARNLLKMGNPIIDITPDKNNKDKTIFVFENTEKFRTDLGNILAEVAKEQPQE